MRPRVFRGRLVAAAAVAGVAMGQLAPGAAQAAGGQVFKVTSASLCGDAGTFEQAVKDAASLPADDMSYFAQMQRGNSLPHRTWLQLNEKRHRMRLAWDAFFQDYDLMLCPVAVTAAFPHDQAGLRHKRTIVVNNKQVPVVDQIFWAGYSGVTWLPSTAAPIGQSPDGLPIGVQIIGRQYGDYECIQFAKLLEKEYRGFVPPPAYS